MKKLTSAVVASSLVFGLVGTAFANYSVETVTKAATRMQTLGVIQGERQADGSLNLVLDQKLTRAQLVTVIVRAWGQSETAKLLVGAPSFPDAASHWASGEIALAKNIAAQNGFALGYPDGTFKPNGMVTAAEAITLTNKFLGIKPTVGLAWPMSDIQAALDAGIITAGDKDMVVNLPNLEANRGLAFYLADRAFSTYKLPNGKTVYTTYVDTSAPTVSVDEYTASTDKASITLTGKVSGHTVLHVGYTGADVVTAKADGTWSATVALKVGVNDVWVHALDIAGNAAEVKNVKVTRVPGAAATVEATLSAALLKAGATADLKVTVSDASGAEIKDAKVDVTVEGEIGTYDAATGKFTAASKPAVGKVMISSGAAPAVTLDVAVVAGDLATIAVSGAASAKIGQALTFTAKGLDAGGNEVALSGVTWSSSTGGVINPATGEFAGTASGTVTITAKAGDISSSSTVAIYADASALKITAVTGLIANGKDTKTVTVAAVDASGNTVTNSAADITLSLSGGQLRIKDSAGNDQTQQTVKAVNGVATFTVYQPAVLATASTFDASTTNLSATSGSLTGALGSASSVKATVGSVQLSATPAGSVFEVSGGNIAISAKIMDTTGVQIVAPAAFDVIIANSNSTSATLAANTLAFTAGASAPTGAQNLTLTGVPGDVAVSGTTTSGHSIQGLSFTTKLAGPAYQMVVTSAPVNNNADTGTFAVKVAVQDSLGTTKTTDSATVVTVVATHSDGTTTTTGTGTAANGIATVNFDGVAPGGAKLTKVGTWTFAISSGTLVKPASVTASVTHGVANQVANLMINGKAAATMVANGTQVGTVTAEVRDASNNLVTDYNGPVKFYSAAAPVSVSGISTTGVTVNAVGGKASTTITAGIAQAGPDTIYVTVAKDSTTNLIGSAGAISATVSTQIVGAATQLVAPVGITAKTAGTDFTLSFEVFDSTPGTPRFVSTDNGRAVSLDILDGTTVVGTQSATTVDGIANFTINLTAAKAYTFKAKALFNGVEGTSTTAAVTVGPAAAKSVTITSALTSIETGTTLSDGLTLVVKDAYGNTVPSDANSTFTGLDLTVNGSTTIAPRIVAGSATNLYNYVGQNAAESVSIADANGLVTFDRDGAGITYAAVADLPVTATAVNTYIAGPAYKVMLTATPAGITAGSNGTINVGVYDGAGNLKTGDSATIVTLTATGTGNPAAITTLNAPAVKGIATFTVPGAEANLIGTYTFEATSGTLVKASGITLTASAGAATKVLVSDVSMTADGSSVQVLTFKVTDANGNVASGFSGTMNFTVSGVGATLLSTSAPISNGQAVVQVKATTQAGTFKVVPTIANGSSAITIAAEGTPSTATDAVGHVTSTAGAPSASTSSVTVSGALYVVVVRDAYGNGVAGIATSRFVQSNGTTDYAAVWTDAGNGVYTATKDGGANQVKVMNTATPAASLFVLQ